MNKAQANQVWDALFTGKVHIEDQIALEREGIPSGYKPGVLKRQLATIETALTTVEPLTL